MIRTPGSGMRRFRRACAGTARRPARAAALVSGPGQLPRRADQGPAGKGLARLPDLVPRPDPPLTSPHRPPGSSAHQPAPPPSPHRPAARSGAVHRRRHYHADMAVRAVIFDWGGTLTPWHGIDHD
ncbi:MAG TPA: hypothetical protein VH642_11650, partial [Streptosporangiaceae bacterium]